MMAGPLKNVLHLTETSDTGGAENMIISLVENLDQSRYRSVVCLLRDGWLNAQLQRRGIETIVIPQPRSVDFLWLYRAYRVLKDRSIHVMHSHEFAMNAYGSLLSAISGIPIVATVHGKNYYCEKWRRRAAYRFAARHSSMVAVSDDLRQFLSQRVGIPLGNIRVVHNGIDLKRYAAHEGDNAVRAELGIGVDQRVIGTVGNLFAVKGQTYLLKACKTVAGEFPTFVLLIAGEGEQMDSLRKEASDLGIARNVRFLGFRNDVPSLLQAMDVFVLPSLSEGLPLSILEALALKKPVVATNVGGVSEIIEDGINGYFVPPKSPEALAHRILMLLHGPGVAARIGEAGRKRVEDAFALERMVREYESLYEHNH
jgi:glycosyltransferase involved in cell wall biosynthesis